MSADDPSERPLPPDDDRLLPANVRALIRTVLGGAGTLDRATRARLYARAVALARRQDAPEIPDDMQAFADKVALWAYKTLDREIDALRQAGRSDDAIFELTICTALGAGAARQVAGLSALEEALGENRD